MDAFDEVVIPGAKTFVNQRAVAADKIDADGAGGTVQRMRKGNGFVAGTGCGNHGDRGDGHPLVNDGNAIFFADILAGFYEVLCVAADLVVHLLAGGADIAVRAVQQRDAHGDGTDIKIFIVDHVDRF